MNDDELEVKRIAEELRQEAYRESLRKMKEKYKDKPGEFAGMSWFGWLIILAWAAFLGYSFIFR